MSQACTCSQTSGDGGSSRSVAMPPRRAPKIVIHPGLRLNSKSETQMVTLGSYASSSQDMSPLHETKELQPFSLLQREDVSVSLKEPGVEWQLRDYEAVQFQTSDALVDSFDDVFPTDNEGETNTLCLGAAELEPVSDSFTTVISGQPSMDTPGVGMPSGSTPAQVQQIRVLLPAPTRRTKTIAFTDEPKEAHSLQSEPDTESKDEGDASADSILCYEYEESVEGLIQAARNDDLEGIERLLRFAGTYGKDGWFALGVCTLRCNVDGVQLLLEKEAGMTLNFKVNVGGWVFEGAASIHIAARQRYTGIVSVLAEREHGLVNGATLLTPLMISAYQGDADGVAILARYGTRQTSKQGRTALMFAAQNGHADCVQLLHDEIGIQDERGWTALCYASDAGHAAVVSLLLPEARMTILHAPERLSSSGVFFNLMSGTALMLAAWNGHADCVRLLVGLEAGMATDKYMNTALLAAATAGHPDCVSILMEYEAKKTDSGGRTALMKAVNEGNIGCAELLGPREAGVTDTRNICALDHAVRSDSAAMVRLILEFEGEKYGKRVRRWRNTRKYLCSLITRYLQAQQEPEM
ncbi:Ankyrin repeat protein 1 [Giardia muris]|uniref:Ankyrin repeat protein 1 n=1 Tax=Giardia muris TaxID=5742 RepID=A0A4Z1T7D1_GIAMU|nr:Ankyrin repeat protein 1 [Giardia muris]|eukprot:TNJ28401.1 Ankyrin repeat protein 1 [Giardia muris]